MHELTNKVVLISGAATGIGAAAVKILLEENVKVSLVCGREHVAILDVAEEAGIKLQDELNSKFGHNKVKFFKCDVTNDDQLFGAFNSMFDEHGYVDMVINNAALMNDSLSCYKKEIEVNVTALITSTLKALELMRVDHGGKGGAVVNVSSVAALCQSSITPIYYATKSAVLQFSNCLGLDDYYSKTGVRVVTLCFGGTKTSLLTTQKMGHFDKQKEAELMQAMTQFQLQSVESAARGLVDVCKWGDSGSTWIATGGKPAKDITETVKEAYTMMSQHVFDE